MFFFAVNIIRYRCHLSVDQWAVMLVLTNFVVSSPVPGQYSTHCGLYTLASVISSHIDVPCTHYGAGQLSRWRRCSYVERKRVGKPEHKSNTGGRVSRRGGSGNVFFCTLKGLEGGVIILVSFFFFCHLCGGKVPFTSVP